MFKYFKYYLNKCLIIINKVIIYLIKREKEGKAYGSRRFMAEMMMINVQWWRFSLR